MNHKHIGKGLISALTILGTFGSLWSPQAFGQTSGVQFDDSAITVDGQSISTPKKFTYQDTSYMPIWYAMQALEKIGITSTWNGSEHRWDMSTSASVDLSQVDIGKGPLSIYMNGTLMKQTPFMVETDPDSGVETVYVPIWYIMQMIPCFNAASSWYDGDWSIFSNIQKDELNTFEKAHPNSMIGYAKTISFPGQAKPALVVATISDVSDFSQISFVSANLTVTDFKSQMDRPEFVQILPAGNHDFVSINGFTGAHTDHNYLFDMSSGNPSLLEHFTGDNGVANWVIDGNLHVLDSNRTYNWDLTAPDGSSDESAINYIYSYDNGSFDVMDEFKSGVFDNEPSLQSNPEFDTISVIWFLQNNANGIGSPDYFSNLPLSSSESTNLKADLPNFSFLKDITTDSPISLKTVDKSNSQADYLYQVGNNSILFSLKNDPQWQITNVTINPSAQTLQNLEGKTS